MLALEFKGCHKLSNYFLNFDFPSFIYLLFIFISVCVCANIITPEINTKELKPFSLNKDKQSSKAIYFYGDSFIN